MKLIEILRLTTLSSAIVCALAVQSSVAQEAPTVVDPVSGIEMSLTDIDFDNLTQEERQDIGDQLKDLGIAPHDGPDAGHDGGHQGGGPKA